MRRIDLIIGVIMALFVFEVYAQQGAPPPDMDSVVGDADTSFIGARVLQQGEEVWGCLLYTSPSPRDVEESRMPSSA